MPIFGFRFAKAFLILSLVTASLGALAPAASASSNFDSGVLQRRDPATGSDLSLGICRLFIGPRDVVQAGTFLLRIGDENIADGYELELRGSAAPDGTGGFTLSADDGEAQDFYEQILHRALKLKKSEFDLRELFVEVAKTDLDLGDEDVTCTLRLSGSILAGNPPLASLSGSSLRRLAIVRTGSPVDLRYAGAGTVFPPKRLGGAAASVDEATEPPPANTAANCPTPDFTPVPDKCATPNCMVTFGNYQWWTEYRYFPPPAYFYSSNNAWSPENVVVDAEGLHLFVRMQDVGAGQQWTAGEAVTALNLDGSPAVLGYGTYLVTAKTKTAASWATLDTNVAFGAFTYERVGTGTSDNPNRELDLAEISRWGNYGGGCRITPPVLCPGNAQFTVQLWDARPDNLHRYTINPNVDTVTLVMEWKRGGQPVVFSQYDGAFTLDNLPATPNNTRTTVSGQNPYIPEDGCQQFHLNLWMGDYTDAVNNYNPPPAAPQEVVVTNFQYRP